MSMIGDYLLSGEPQIGGYARLYRAVHSANIDEVVAVKVFDPPVHVESRVLNASWMNELETYQRLGDSSHLSRLLDWGRTEDGAPYLVFEWLEGDLMNQVTKNPPEGWDDFWPIARDVLTGLELIHTAGFVHRDLKPENVLLGKDGHFKVADFGTTRLVEAMRAGITMAPLGTLPYSPPELGTPGPSAAYDLYSFAVMTLVCLAGEIPDADDVQARFTELDLPPDIGATLATCLSQSVADRPEDASVLLARLKAAQEARERRREPVTDIHLTWPPQTLRTAAKLLSLPITGIEQGLLEDLSAVCAFSFDTRAERPVLQACGQTLVFRLEPDPQHPSTVRVIRVSKATSQTLDIAHATWLRANVRIRTTLPSSPATALAVLQDFCGRVSENDAARAAWQSERASATEFATWRQILKAKFTIEDERGVQIKYRGWKRHGARVRFTVGDLPDLEIGENRLVTNGRRRVLFGEIEQVDNGELVLYVTKGDPSQLPKQGTLDFDAEASKSKLRREQAALDRLSCGKAVRPHLRTLLLDPGKATPPAPVAVDSFFTPNLDHAKQEAISAALGSTDALVVEGPPGTGKTTFIAEVVAQELFRNPDSRILLTAQTHVAVDHALAGIATLNPEASIVRIGRQDQMAEGIEDLGLTARLAQARDAVVDAGRLFLRALAIDLGLDVDNAEVDALVADLEARITRLTQVRSRLALKRDERKVLSEQVAKHQEVAMTILDVASSIERAIDAGSTSELMDAGRLFLESGVNLASSLESGGPLGEKLVAIEQVLADLSGQLSTETEAESVTRGRLAGLIGAEPSIKAQDLLAQVSTRSSTVDDPRYNRLTELAAEWSERFGKGSEFNAVVIAGASVIGATCVGLTGVRGADSVDFDLCIVDEASKATATEVLVPLVQSRRWILVGDQKQLPPFVEQSLHEAGFLDRFELNARQVGQTLFAELADGLPSAAVVSLTHQHRMHPAIGGLISDCFYDSRLTSGERPVDDRVQLALGSPVTWLDTSSVKDCREVASGTSYLNQREVRTTGEVLRRLNFVAEKSGRLKVAILTGYDPQRRALLDFVNRHEMELPGLDLHVANVDAYQGQEADVAIFNVTRSNATGQLGFLQHEERINVALSRARDGLVIVGDASFIRASKSIRNPLRGVLDHIESHAEWCSLRSVDGQ
ncbi:AAA domain-containing protein [Nocardioides sp. WV_118_6]